MKRTIDDLAIFGGTPFFQEKLHVGRPNIGDREKLFRRFNDMLDRRWFTNDGPYVQELEKKIEKYLGVKHALLICNGTAALEIGYRALGFQGEVIVPSFTFIATPHALQWQGITPVFCDIGVDSHNIDPTLVEQYITPRTTGIVGVHVWGKPCDTDAINGIAKRNNLRILYDAAHAFGCSYQGRMIGNFGDAEVFSFHATKFFNTFEGGCITTNIDEVAQSVRYMRNFGFKDYDDVQYLGINGKMSEISAAMGLTLFECLEDTIIKTNYKNYIRYCENLSGLNGVKVVKYDDKNKNNYQYIILEIEETLTTVSRDTIVKILQAENILARRYFFPGCHEMEPYCSLFPNSGKMLENTNKLTRRVLSLPTGTSISNNQVDSICDLIKFILEENQGIAGRLN